MTLGGSPGAVRGAYGLSLPGFPPERLVVASDSWPRWGFSWRVGPPPAIQELDDEHAVLKLQPAGFTSIDRHAQHTTLILDEPPSDEALIHPLLGSTAVITSYWAGFPTFHAGSFCWNGAVWGVLGDREQGKSSLLAWLASRDIPVFSDDLVVVDNGNALAGPRCLDLRRGAAEHFKVGELVAGAGTRDRWRVALPDVPAQLPLGGWIDLQWAQETHVEKIAAAERLRRLEKHRGLKIGAISSPAWLRALAPPLFTFSRQRHWGQIDSAMADLLRVLDSTEPT